VKHLYEQAWLQAKRDISAARRQIRSLLAEWEAEEGSSAELPGLKQAYEAIAIQIRTHINLPALRDLLQQHQELEARLMERALAAKPAAHANHEPLTSESLTENPASRSEVFFAHYKYTNLNLNKDCSPLDSGLQESVAEPSVPIDPVLAAGVQHVTLKAALQAASHRLRERLPAEQRPLNWQDLTEAAYGLRPQFGISQASWGEACAVLGRIGATLCLLVTDQATLRQHDPVLKPPAYFNAMIAKARAGELRLHSSVFGLIERSDAEKMP
jgi:replication initiation protein RepC